MNAVVKYSIILILLITGCSQKKSEPESNKTIPNKKAIVNESRVFDFQPEMPLNGELNAVIELGALGLNYFIIEIDNEARWSLKDQAFGRSNIIYGESTPEEIISNIGNFKKEILNFGVSAQNLHLVLSSSVIDSDISTLKNQLSNLNIPVVTVDSQMEAKYALMATIPKEFAKESFIVDVGSGNTKLSWVNSNDTSTIEIHGSKYFLGDVRDTTVFREVRDAILEIPDKNRNLCFILGGIIYEFAKADIDSKDQRYFVLKDPSSYKTDTDKLRAGNVIYNALHLEPTYSYIFDSQSNFSIGYLVSLKKD